MTTVHVRVGPTEVEIDAPVHEDLTNWGLWQQQRVGGTRRTGSAEGRYRSEPSMAAGAAKVDPGRAMNIERIVGAPEFPRQAAVMLRHHYVWGSDWRATSRVTGVRWSDYGNEFRRATLMVRNRKR